MIIKGLSVLILTAMGNSARAQVVVAAAPADQHGNDMFGAGLVPWFLVIVSVVLLIVIVLLSAMVKNAFLKQLEQKTSGKLPLLLLALTCLQLLPLHLQAQDAAGVKTPTTADLFGGNTLSWILLFTIAIEFFVILWMLTVLKRLLGIDSASVKTVVATPDAVKPKKVSWWDRFNRSASLEEEKDIQLDHNYDGIRELDNKLPPWWVYGFYATIVFACIYLWRYHVSQSAPLQLEELNIDIANAEAEMKKRAINGLDENTVTLLTDAADISSGKALFIKNCIACHGPEGQGAAVGPNLTDDYWLHGGGVKDLFKTIKYGVQGKGMQAWQAQLRPVEIAQLIAFIKSQHGKTLANPKAPQGDLYTEGSTGDSTMHVMPDSIVSVKDTLRHKTR